MPSRITCALSALSPAMESVFLTNISIFGRVPDRTGKLTLVKTTHQGNKHSNSNNWLISKCHKSKLVPHSDQSYKSHSHLPPIKRHIGAYLPEGRSTQAYILRYINRTLPPPPLFLLVHFSFLFIHRPAWHPREKGNARQQDRPAPASQP